MKSSHTLFRALVSAALVIGALSACSDAAPSAAVDASLAVDASRSDDLGADADVSSLDLGGASSDLGVADLSTSRDDSGALGDDAGPPGGDAGPPATEGCFTDVRAGHHVFACAGVDYDVEISAPCALGGCGLIFDVHGATMNAASEDRNTNLRALGSAAGYVVVQPTGPTTAIGPQWDPVRDDPKVFAFLELSARALRIDARRIHFTGFSQGGFMSWRMLCDHADVFASIAPAAACGTLFRHCPFTPSDRPEAELPVLYVHGSRDNIVPGCGGAMRDTVVAGWSMTPASPVSMDADHTWSRYTSASGNVFEFIDHSYSARSLILGGHCLPGSTDISSSTFAIDGYGCDHSSPITWGAAVLAFFQAHPRS